MDSFNEKLCAILNNATRLLREMGVSPRDHAGWAIGSDGRIFALTPAWPEKDQSRWAIDDAKQMAAD